MITTNASYQCKMLTMMKLDVIYVENVCTIYFQLFCNSKSVLKKSNLLKVKEKNNNTQHKTLDQLISAGIFSLKINTMVFILIVSFSSSLLIVKLISKTTKMNLTCPHQWHKLCGIAFFLQHPCLHGACPVLNSTSSFVSFTESLLIPVNSLLSVFK